MKITTVLTKKLSRKIFKIKFELSRLFIVHLSYRAQGLLDDHSMQNSK